MFGPKFGSETVRDADMFPFGVPPWEGFEKFRKGVHGHGGDGGPS